MPFQLGYVSTAAEQMLRDDLLRILSVARHTNREKCITGLLLFDGTNFLQVLEGDEEAVREIFAHIAQDTRHRDLSVLFEDQVARPEFEQWSMGFQAMDGVDWMEFPITEAHPGDLKHLIERYGEAKKLLLKMRQYGLDPNRDLVTSA
jgi:hypothetical protein